MRMSYLVKQGGYKRYKLQNNAQFPFAVNESIFCLKATQLHVPVCIVVVKLQIKTLCGVHDLWHLYITLLPRSNA